MMYEKVNKIIVKEKTDMEFKGTVQEIEMENQTKPLIVLMAVIYVLIRCCLKKPILHVLTYLITRIIDENKITSLIKWLCLTMICNMTTRFIVKQMSLYINNCKYHDEEYDTIDFNRKNESRFKTIGMLKRTGSKIIYEIKKTIFNCIIRNVRGENSVQQDNISKKKIEHQFYNNKDEMIMESLTLKASEIRIEDGVKVMCKVTIQQNICCNAPDYNLKQITSGSSIDWELTSLYRMRKEKTILSNRSMIVINKLSKLIKKYANVIVALTLVVWMFT